ncbi:MAG: hypothetical protein COA32_01650 [Fluviicola sp.]|nr:MAG: hypothetical protein COA32_01650 [Fluviicola sp.]
MKKLLLSLFIGTTLVGYGQTCTIDYSQTAAGIYPDTLPTATVGEFYDTDISFLFPTDTAGFDFTNFEIIDVNAPSGLDWECNNDANGCNYDPQVEPYGCARVWGTPTIPGQYTVAIDVIADLTIQSGNLVTFNVYIEVLPPIQSNAGFAMSPGFGCGETEVEFTNNNPSAGYTPIPNQTQGFIYSWDFDNGNQSNQENPANQIYTTTGDYYIDYSCVVDTFGFFLEGITLNNVNCTDAIGYGEPDLYVNVYDGDNTLIFTNISSSNDADLPQTISMSVQLNNPPYTVQVWDNDDDNLWGTDPENCVDNSEGSTQSVTLQLPSINSYGTTTLVGSNGSLNFSYDINKPIIQIETTDTLSIYGVPATPIINDVLSIPLLSTDDLGFDYQWNLDGTPIAGEITNEITPTIVGTYTVTATDTNGCSSTSAPFEYDNVGISEESLAHFQLFPNPAKETVGIIFNSGIDAKEVVLTDLTGRVINRLPIYKNDQVILDVSKQSSGVYLVSILDSNGEKYTSKLIVE